MRLTQYEHEKFAHQEPLVDVGGRRSVDAPQDGTALPDPTLWPGPQPLPGAQPHYSAILINDALSLSSNALAQDDVALQSVLNSALGAVAQQLRSLAGDARGFELLLEQLYGSALNRSAAETLRQSISAGDFSWTPNVQLSGGAELGGTALRFDAGSHTVLLNRDVLRNGPAQAEQALMGCLPDVLRARLTAPSPSPAPAPAPQTSPVPTLTPAPVPVLVATPPAPNPAAQDSAALNTALNAVAQQLQDLARDPQGFVVLLEQLYGAALNRQTGDDFRCALLAGDFRWAPDVRLVSSTELGGSVLRADAGSGTVWLNREVLHNDPTQAQQALLGSLPDVLRGRLTVSGSSSTSAPSPAPAVQQTSSALSDAATHDNALLDDSLKAVAQWLTTFAGDAPGFARRLEQLYGSSLNTQAAEARRQSILAGDFSWAPAVRLASQPELGSSAVRYDASSHTVLLSVDLLRRSPLEAQQALLDSLPDILRGQLTSSSSGASATQGQHTSQGTAQSNTSTTTSQASQTTNGTGASDRSGQSTSTIMGPQPSANQITGLPPTVLLLDPAHATIALEHGTVVSTLWLEQRAVVLDAIGTFIHQSFQHALTQGPGALGWRTFEPHWRDGPNGPERDPIGPQGQVLKWVPAAPGSLSSSAQSAADGQDSALPAPQGQWWGFCHDTFKQQLQALVVAQPSPALQQLGTLYGVSADSVFQQHPELWDLAQKTDRSLNAGPPPVAGAAMGDVTQLGMLDLHLRDPLNQQLIQTFGGTVAEPTSSLALEQIRLYGRERWERLTRLDNALATVRDTFTNDMAQARASNGPGWVDVPMQTGTDPQTGQPVGIYQLDADGIALRDSQGQPLLATTRVFNPEVFAKQWLAQGGFVQEAFRTLFGEVSTQIVRTEQVVGDNTEPAWVAQNSLSGSPYVLDEFGLRHMALAAIDLNAPPRLINDAAIGFDVLNGWSTHYDNLYQKPDTLELVVQIAVVAAVSYFTAGAATNLGAGVIASGAAAGAAGALTSGLLNDNVSLKAVVKGALSGALMAALVPQINLEMSPTEIASTLIQRGLAQGGVNMLLGESFTDGLASGLASGAATLLSLNIDAQLTSALQSGQISASEAFAAQALGKVLVSAVRALGTPNDPLRAFAADLINTMVQDALASAHQAVRAQEWIDTNDAIVARRGRDLLEGEDTAGSEPNDSSAVESLSRTGAVEDRSAAPASDSDAGATRSSGSTPTTDTRTLLNEAERSTDPQRFQSVAGQTRIARPGEGISALVGTSDPQAIGNFMRANGLTTDVLQVGRSYFVPDDPSAYGDSRALGQAALNWSNQRIVNVAADGQAELDRLLGRYPANERSSVSASAPPAYVDPQTEVQAIVKYSLIRNDALGLGSGPEHQAAWEKRAEELVTVALRYKELTRPIDGSPFTADSIYNGLVADALQARAMSGRAIDRSAVDQTARLLIETGAHVETAVSTAMATAAVVGRKVSTSEGRANAASGASLQAELSARAGVQPDTSNDAFYIANTNPRVAINAKFDWDHVLAGEVKNAGRTSARGTGYHAESAANGSAHIVDGTPIKQNSNGTYEAKVQVWDDVGNRWVDKPRESTFFPVDWSQARIEYEVSQAYAGGIANGHSGNFFWPSPSGIKIQFHWDPSNNRTTFYPLGN